VTSGFGSLALILACVGVYGIMAHAVGRRVNEIGVRMSLGAQARPVLLMVLREASWHQRWTWCSAAAHPVSPLDALRSNTHRPVHPGRGGATVICYCCIGRLGAGAQSFAHPTDAGASSRMSVWPTSGDVSCGGPLRPVKAPARCRHDHWPPILFRCLQPRSGSIA
jgi:hypothetical protein